MTGALPRNLALLIALIAVTAIASPMKVKLPEHKHAHVGQLFLVHLGADNLDVHLEGGKSLPKWMKYEDQTLYGIPQTDDIGNYLVTVTGNGFSNTVNITAKNEFTNPCGEASTVWIEYYVSDSFSDLSLSEQRAEIEQQAETYDVPAQEIRIYSFAYKDVVMSTTDTLSDQLTKQPTEDTAVLLWRISCSELDVDAVETVQTAVDNNAEFSVRQGHVSTKDERNLHDLVQTATEATPMRTTRRIEDNAPVRMNSLPSFKCKRGIVCVLNLPPKTFLDAEDGDETKLRLSVHATVASKNFLTIVPGRAQMRGVPMEKGDFGFRLEARDSSNQVTSGAFQVTVEDGPPSNHRFIMLLEPSIEKLTKDPTTLVNFADRLSTSLNDRDNPEHVQILSLKAKGSKSELTWSNSSISHKFCHRPAINAIKREMTFGSQNKAKVEFVRSVGVQFHVNSVALELFGNCDRPQTAPTTPFTEVGDSNASEVTVKEAEAQPAGDSMLIIVLLVLLAVVALIGALICWFTLRRKAEQKKKQSADYVSKGMPVVFPEEVPHEEESATVASPMLVKEERPPLVVSHHDNPLYKPPPPLTAGTSPRPKTAASNQRLPPPYVPP